MKNIIVLVTVLIWGLFINFASAEDFLTGYKLSKVERTLDPLTLSSHRDAQAAMFLKSPTSEVAKYFKNTCAKNCTTAQENRVVSVWEKDYISNQSLPSAPNKNTGLLGFDVSFGVSRTTIKAVFDF